MPTAGHLLAIYRTRRDMQRRGTTNPAECVKEFCEELVSELEKLDPTVVVEMIDLPSGRVDFVADGVSLATMPSDPEIVWEFSTRES